MKKLILYTALATIAIAGYSVLDRALRPPTEKKQREDDNSELTSELISADLNTWKNIWAVEIQTS